MTDVPFRGFSSLHPEKITNGGRVVLRWRESDACVPCKFYGYVTSGSADHGQRSQEEIRSLNISHGLCMFVVEHFCPPFLIYTSFITTAVNTSYLSIAYAIVNGIQTFSGFFRKDRDWLVREWQA